MAPLVVDTSALMAVLNDEPEVGAALAALDQARQRHDTILMPFLVLMEAEYLAIRAHSESEADAYMSVVNTWPMEVIESSEVWRREAARVKAAGDISVVDAWVAALALIRDAEVLHKDPQFDRVRGLKTINIGRRH